MAIDGRQPRDGRVIEELGSYDPMVKNTDDRVKMKLDRVDYWTSVGAQPSENVAVLVKKYRKKMKNQATTAAERPVIDALVLALRPVADVPQVNLDQPVLKRQFQQALRQIALENLRKQGQHIEAHGDQAVGAVGSAGVGGAAAACFCIFLRYFLSSTATFSDGSAPTLDQ